MQTILGSGGTVGSELTKALINYTDQIKLVSRNPKKINETDILFPADLSDASHIDKAVEGSEVVYVTIGFDYDIKVWREKWPSFIEKVIASCIKHNAKLVFFDNIYMYDRDFLTNMTEETPIRPTSKKGEVRAQIAKMIMDAVKSGKLTALIARSADFYGPNNDKSVLIETVYKNLAKGKPADWFASLDKIHTFTYTPDAGKATALLGNTPDAYNQVWHVPTDNTPLKGKDWVELFAKEMNIAPKSRALPLFIHNIIGWFVPIMKELYEMAYQYDRDYVFKSQKFEQRFGIKPTTPQEGVKKTIEYYKSQK